MYESFYKFSSRPFQLSPDPRFFYASKGHKRALAYLRYGIKQGEGFIIVTGDVGTGKSMLIGALFQSLARENVVAAQVVTTQMQADDLLRFVAAAFGLAFQRVSKAALLKNLETFFRSCVQEGKRVLLVVDEAQNLPKRSIEELRMLSNFQMAGRALLQSFLLGQKEFRSTMRSQGFEQLRQRVIAAYHLRPLDADETHGYIIHRLHRAGWKGDPAFSDEVFDGIYQFTAGVPRRINTLCDRLLLYGSIEELHSIDSKALGIVAQDIIEEHGGLEYNQDELLNPEGQLELAPQPAPERHVEAPKTAALPRGQNGAQRSGSDQRLAAVESSMEALTKSMREEMALLRKSLLEQQGKKSQEEN